MFPRLPHWVVPNKFPAFYDSESATAIEMTAKIYKHVESLIDDYNKFADTVNTSIEEFENGVTTDIELFKVSMRQEFQDFIDIIELRIRDAENFMKTHLDEYAENYLKGVVGKLEDAIGDFTAEKEYFREEFEKQTANILSQNNTLAQAIAQMNSNFAEQNERIDGAVEYMTTRIDTITREEIQTLISNGEIVFGFVYDENTESATFAMRDIRDPLDLELQYDPTTESILIKEVE